MLSTYIINIKYTYKICVYNIHIHIEYTYKM